MKFGTIIIATDSTVLCTSQFITVNNINTATVRTFKMGAKINNEALEPGACKTYADSSYTDLGLKILYEIIYPFF